MYFLGVDGGGMKIIFILVDEELNIVGIIIKGICYYN